MFFFLLLGYLYGNTTDYAVPLWSVLDVRENDIIGVFGSFSTMYGYKINLEFELLSETLEMFQTPFLSNWDNLYNASA